MIKYVHCKEGKKWCLTELGFEIGKIRAKYENESRLKSQYEKVVPSQWIENGYVKEVDI